MKKILDILFVHRIETENKWWHRLAIVLIYGSTALVVLCAGAFVFSDTTSWKTYKYTAYNFELKYQNAEGQETNCSFSAYDYVSPLIFCGDIRDSRDLMMRIKNRYASSTNEDLLNSLNSIDLKSIDKDSFEEKLRSLFTPMELKTLTWDGLVNAGIKNNLFDNIKVKKQNVILYKNIGEDVLYAILSILGWFIFWESIVYRTILYIIFGKKK